MEFNMELNLSPVSNEKEYWLNRLAAPLPKTEFPFYIAHPAKEKIAIDTRTIEWDVDGNLFSSINALSKDSDVRLYMILTASLVTLLYKYSGSDDIVLGAPIYKQEIEGDFVNTILVLRNRIDHNMTFKELLLQVRESILEATKNQNVSMESLMEELGIPFFKDSLFPLFSTAILVENIHLREYLQHINIDTLFSFSKESACLEGKIEYNASRYEPSYMEKIVTHFNFLLSRLLSNVDSPIGDAEVLSEDEKKQILEDFNNTQRDMPIDRTIHSALKTQVEKNPGKAAVKIENNCLTYKDLDEKSDSIARELCLKGVIPGSIVGIVLENSLAMAAAIFGVLKAGCAYLPIDPNYPPDRRQYMLEDSRASAVITKSDFSSILSFFSKVMINIPDNLEFDNSTHDSSIPAYNESPADNAYVIYTSGSTGMPKGVAVTHRNVLNYALWRIDAYRQTDSDASLQLVSFSFDGFGSNFYPTLLSGGKVVFFPDEKWKDFSYIRGLITAESITNFSTVPSAMKGVLEGAQPSDFTGLRFVVLAGEKPDTPFITRCRELMPQVLFINEYGPTENTVTAAAHMGITPGNEGIIGTPIYNNSIYILDQRQKPIPVGSPGEIYISGDSLSRGYLDKPAMTDAAFLKNPFIPNRRMYKTGDMARWLPGGKIEFMGRMDRQVKIRGFRIEPAEIENQLLNFPKIKEVAVVAKEDKRDGNYLSAYFTSEEIIDIALLREHAMKILPDYMIPAYFTRLVEMPLTPNRKLDRKKLLELNDKTEIESDYVAPRNEIEKKLVDIWQAELGLEKVGIRDNYFNIGGDSINSISLLSIINAAFNRALKVVDLYTHNTVETLAIKIDETGEEKKTDEYSDAANKIDAMKEKILKGMRKNE